MAKRSTSEIIKLLSEQPKRIKYSTNSWSKSIQIKITSFLWGELKSFFSQNISLSKVHDKFNESSDFDLHRRKNSIRWK